MTSALHDHYVTEYDEAHRLETTIRGRLEAHRIRELLRRYLPEPPKQWFIADVGGGPGAHAVWLEEVGHRVVLVDPIAEHVEQAREQGVTAMVGDARELPWDADTFGMTLLAGPVYHLTDEDERMAALVEAVRITEPGGIVAVVALNRFANLIGAAIANQLIERQQIVEDIIESGSSADNDRWPAPTYYHTISELHTELLAADLTSVMLHGVSGPGGWQAVAVDRYGLDETGTTFQNALLAARMADEYPELMYSCANLMAVGRVRR